MKIEVAPTYMNQIKNYLVCFRRVFFYIKPYQQFSCWSMDRRRVSCKNGRIYINKIHTWE